MYEQREATVAGDAQLPRHVQDVSGGDLPTEQRSLVGSSRLYLPSVHIAMLPYIEQANLHEMFDYSRWIWGPSSSHDHPAPPPNENAIVTSTRVAAFICPTGPSYADDPSRSTNHYAWNMGSTIYWDNVLENGPHRAIQGHAHCEHS